MSTLWILLRQQTPCRVRKSMMRMRVSCCKNHRIHTPLRRLHLIPLLAHTSSPAIPCLSIRKISKGWLWMTLFTINIANLIVICCAHFAARCHEFNSEIGDGGSHNTKLAATSRWGSQGRAFDHKQAVPGGSLIFFSFLKKKSLLYLKKRMIKQRKK